MAPGEARFSDLVIASRDVAAEPGRKGKVERLAALLRSLSPPEAAIAATYLAGALPQGRIGVGPARIDKLGHVSPAAAGEITLVGLDQTLAEIAALSGAGSQVRKGRSLAAVLGRMTRPEQDLLLRLLLGELRQGAVAGLIAEAIAAAVPTSLDTVRRALMLSGDIARVATVAFEDGPAGLAAISLTLFVPIAPMLAQSADDLEDAVARLAAPFLEFKLDGARVQVHKRGEEVRVFSRRGNDVTVAVPELVEALSALPVSELVLDGETLALRQDGRPQPFQTTMRRFGRRLDVDTLRRELPLQAFFFDCLLVNGRLLIDDPATDRFAALSDALGASYLVPRCHPSSRTEAAAFLDLALARGHEGLMAKDPASVYQAGGRGGHWLKVKQAHTLDLAVLAAEWGSGRREPWLSNLHLGARLPGGGFAMLGKTFKGLSDAVLAWQTQQLLAREIGRQGGVVHVRPELVVEIAFNELQESPRYPAGLALRFARVKRYRPDKPAAEADTLDTVRSLFARQIAYQG
jgi:DNA ligase-1